MSEGNQLPSTGTPTCSKCGGPHWTMFCKNDSLHEAVKRHFAETPPEVVVSNAESLREKCPVCGDQGCTNCGRVPQPFELWKHFKGGFYEIVDVDTLFVTDGVDLVLVRYRNEKGKFARTLPDFIMHMDRPEYTGPRFVKLTDMVCKLCGSPAEFIEKEQVWRHKGPNETYFVQTFCDKYGYPIPVAEPPTPSPIPSEVPHTTQV